MVSVKINHLDLALLPVSKKDHLCKLLDQNDVWEELGSLMQFSEFDIAVRSMEDYFIDDVLTFIIHFHFRILTPKRTV